APMVSALPTSRAASLTWEHDWLGNVTEWTDDAHAFYERSIGAATNGADVGVAADLRPTAIYLAADLDGPPTSRGGWLELDYGESGNVAAMTVHGECADAPSAACVDSASNDIQARRDAL